MATGQIIITKGSTTVTGSGTKFKTEISVGDFIYAIVGGINYSLGVSAIASDTSLTVNVAYSGATTSALAFTVVPQGVLVGITAQIAADAQAALRAAAFDKNNWQQVLAGSGTVTVTLPDGSTYTGPAWLGMSSTMKQNASDIAKRALLGGSATQAFLVASNTSNTANAVPVSLLTSTITNLALKGASKLDVGTTANTVAAGNDSRLGTIDGKSGGTLTSVQFVDNSTGVSFCTKSDSKYDGNKYYWGNSYLTFMAGKNRPNAKTNVYEFENEGIASGLKLEVNYGGTRNDFNFQDNGTATAVNWSSSSDKRIKEQIAVIASPFDVMRQFRGCTWQLKTGGGGKGIGFIAQSIQSYDSDLVSTSGATHLSDGSTVDNTLSVNAGQIAAGVHHEAILSLMSIMKQGLTIIAGQTTDAATKSSLVDLAALIPDESTYATQ